MKRLSLFCISLALGTLCAGWGPAANEEMVGAWQGYILNHGEVTFMSPVVYHFLPSGTWSIQDGERDAIPQGWYKLDSGAIYLQPLRAALAKENAAIKAHRKSRNAFEISNPIDENLGMLFIRKTAGRTIDLEDTVGIWKLRQRNLYTGKTKEAPFLLHIRKDLTYHVTAEDAASLSEEWMSGKVKISGERLYLKNRYDGSGLWNKPSFFLLDGKLRYNNSLYCLWCERISEEEE